METLLASAGLLAALAFGTLWWRERRLARRERQERATLIEAMEATPCNFAVYGADRILVACNEAYRELHREGFATLTGPVLYDDLMRAACTRTLPAEEVEAEVARRVANHEACLEQGFDRLYPHERWMRVQKRRMRSGAVAGFALDITHLKERERALEASEARLRAMVDDAPIGIWQLNAEGRTIFANPTLARLFGRRIAPETLAESGYDPPAEAAPGLPFGFVPGRRTELRLPDSRNPDRTLLVVASEWLRDADGAASVVLTLLDITSLRLAQAQLEHLARHDALTGLANREAFQDAIERLAEAGGALILIDLDHFKDANDRHGHEAGDALLVAVADRLRAAVRPTDLVVRLGGDEFALVVPGAAAETAEAIAERAGRLVREPLPFNGAMLAVGASVGIALAPADAREAEALQRAADLALYQSKAERQGRPRRFDAGLRHRADAQTGLLGALPAALAEGAFTLAFQPQLRLPSRERVGAAVLPRWESASLGRTVSTEELLAAATEARLLPALDAWVLERAVAQLAAWSGRAEAPAVLAVNLSLPSLLDPALADRLAGLLLARRVEPNRLEIGLPPALAAREPEGMAPVLRRLTETGVGLALDGFGGAPLTLAGLAALPIGRVRLDARLTQALEGPQPPRAALGAALALARSVGAEVLAVGVDTEAQAFALRRQGVTLVQGLLTGAPMEAATLLGGDPEAEGRALAR